MDSRFRANLFLRESFHNPCDHAHCGCVHWKSSDHCWAHTPKKATETLGGHRSLQTLQSSFILLTCSGYNFVTADPSKVSFCMIFAFHRYLNLVPSNEVAIFSLLHVYFICCYFLVFNCNQIFFTFANFQLKMQLTVGKYQLEEVFIIDKNYLNIRLE